MKISNLKSSIINETFFMAQKELNLSMESLLSICARGTHCAYFWRYPALDQYQTYTRALDYLLMNNFNRINFQQLKRSHYKFLNRFFTNHESLCLENRDFCLKFIECMDLSLPAFEALFKVYPFLTQTSIKKIEEENQPFYDLFWTTVFQHQNLSISSINRFYLHCTHNKKYAALLSSAQKQFWSCNQIIISTILQKKGL